MTREERLEELIRWMAIPWTQAGNRPVFATRLPNGEPLESGERCRQTYDEVIGAEGREGPGVWEQCWTCRQWHIAHPDSDRHLTGHDVLEIARDLRGRP